MLYYPYGEERYGEGASQTDYGFTGQRNEGPGLGGLMDYTARHYDPSLGRFISADTVVPGTGSQAHNRYMYVGGNPVRYTDPTGHGGSSCSRVCNRNADGEVTRCWWECTDEGGTVERYDHDIQRGDILLNSTGSPVPGYWDHARMVVYVDPNNPNIVWVVEAHGVHGVWHHRMDLGADNDDWVVVRPDASFEDREAAASWAEQLAGYDGSANRVETTGAPFVSMVPTPDSPWGWLDKGAGEEGYYCFEVVVDAYTVQGVDVTNRGQRMMDYPTRSQLSLGTDFTVHAAVAINNLTVELSPYIGDEIYGSSITYEVGRKE